MPETPLTTSDLIERNAGLLSTQVGDELFLLSVPAGKYFSLDEIGSQIWNWLGEPSPVSEVLGKLVQNYNNASDDLERDLLNLLADFRRYGLIKVKGRNVIN